MFIAAIILPGPGPALGPYCLRQLDKHQTTRQKHINTQIYIYIYIYKYTYKYTNIHKNTKIYTKKTKMPPGPGWF